MRLKVWVRGVLALIRQDNQKGSVDMAHTLLLKEFSMLYLYSTFGVELVTSVYFTDHIKTLGLVKYIETLLILHIKMNE